MTTKQEELFLEKVQIEREIDTVDTQMRDVQEVENSYEAFFNQFTCFASSLQEQYYRSKTSWFLEEQVTDLHRKQQQAFDSLIEEQTDLKKQQRTLEEDRDNLYNAYQQTFSDEQEEQADG